MANNLQEQILEMFFGLQGFSLKKVKLIDNKIYIYIEKNSEHRCSVCNKKLDNHKYDSYTRKIFLGIVNLKPVYACFKQYRLSCPNCGIRVESQSISEGKSRYSKKIGKLVIQYTQHMSCSAASHLLGIAERTVRKIDKHELKKKVNNHIKNVKNIKQIGIDEVSHKKRHNYGTVVVNQADGKVIWMSQNRSTESLEKIYNKFNHTFRNLEAVSMDFWKPYFKATRIKHPKAFIVYDRFHLSRILNRYIEEERRAYQKSLSDDDRKYMKKHTRWLLLRRKKNFEDYHIDRLKELKEKNEKLYEMYLLKEDFLSIFSHENTRETAKTMILEWLSTVEKSCLEAIKKFACSVLKRLKTILNWFDYPISNGKSEGVNNVIKTLLKQGYGYKDFEYFRLKVLQKCGYLMVNLND